MTSERERMQIIAVLEEMRAEVALAQGRVTMRNERLEEIDRRIQRMRELHEADRRLQDRTHGAH